MSHLSRINAEMNDIISTLEQSLKSSHKISQEHQASVVHLPSPEKNSNSLKQNASGLFTDNHQDSITAKTFLFTHLYNRDIRDLPLSKENNADFDRLRACSIFTITDLIGRYLIHRTPEEFRQFLSEKIQCSQTFTDEMMQLMNEWTSHNLQIGRETRSTILEQYL